MKTLIEQCQKVNISEILKDVEIELRLAKLQTKIEALGKKISTTTTPCHFGGTRFWFICPGCSRRIGTLYKTPMNDELLCRKCHGLRYGKSRYKGMIEGITFSSK
ncbi:hypothetical protein KGQ27_03420 [Patescibacteria group bacterium]|nr:hypothetical protein [Patescibacteria group bacterium]MDE1946903.1 hypothetical protein [Patescibacteria group bacterium]MDE2011104.1 hypothetical protein [Patescibacteria group bacterium]